MLYTAALNGKVVMGLPLRVISGLLILGTTTAFISRGVSALKREWSKTGFRLAIVSGVLLFTAVCAPYSRASSIFRTPHLRRQATHRRRHQARQSLCPLKETASNCDAACSQPLHRTTSNRHPKLGAPKRQSASMRDTTFATIQGYKVADGSRGNNVQNAVRRVRAFGVNLAELGRRCAGVGTRPRGQGSIGMRLQKPGDRR